GRRSAPSEGGPQTGDRGGVSYPGLVLDLDGTESGEELLDEVVLLVVERRPAEAAEAERPPQRIAPGIAVLPAPGPGGDDALGDHVHRLSERQLLPPGPVGSAVANGRQATRCLDQTPRRRALGAQPAPGDRAVGIAFDGGDPPVLHEDALATADRAVRTHRRHDALGTGGPGPERGGARRPGGETEGPSVAVAQLAQHRPTSSHHHGDYPRRSAGKRVRLLRESPAFRVGARRSLDDGRTEGLSSMEHQIDVRDNAGIGELFSRLTADLSKLVRDEVALAKVEITQAVSSARTAGISMGTAALLGL